MADTLPLLQISADEHRARAARLAEFLRGQDLTGAVLFDRDYIRYYTGFAFIPTERPMAFTIDAAGNAALTGQLDQFVGAKGLAYQTRHASLAEGPPVPASLQFKDILKRRPEALTPRFHTYPGRLAVSLRPIRHTPIVKSFTIATHGRIAGTPPA